jgi:transcriptional regulator with XRE-family HTH domain
MLTMAAIERGIDRALREAERTLARLGREVRLARLEHDLSQSTAARAAGLSRSSWSRLERGVARNVSLVDLARAAAAVGLVLQVRLYPGGEPVRDAGHLALLERLRSCLPDDARWSTEVPFPNPGDLRAWDAMIRLARVRVGTEAETRGRDSQALQRKLALKRRDGNVDHIVLLLADTRHNRSFLRAAGEGLLKDFPVPGPVALERLRAGRDPGGNSIILL